MLPTWRHKYMLILGSSKYSYALYSHWNITGLARDLDWHTTPRSLPVETPDSAKNEKLIRLLPSQVGLQAKPHYFKWLPKTKWIKVYPHKPTQQFAATSTNLIIHSSICLLYPQSNYSLLRAHEIRIPRNHGRSTTDVCSASGGLQDIGSYSIVSYHKWALQGLPFKQPTRLSRDSRHTQW